MTSERPIEFGPAPLEKVSMVIETWPQLHRFIHMLVEMLETVVYLQGIIRCSDQNTVLMTACVHLVHLIFLLSQNIIHIMQLGTITISQKLNCFTSTKIESYLQSGQIQFVDTSSLSIWTHE